MAGSLVQARQGPISSMESRGWSPYAPAASRHLSQSQTDPGVSPSSTQGMTLGTAAATGRRKAASFVWQR